MTMVLAGLGGVLIAPLFQLQDTLITFVVLGSLAAVVLGGLRSIPIAFAGGLLLGVVQNLFAGYSDDFLPNSLSRLSGLQSAVPYILVILLLLVFGRDRSRRAGSVSDERPRPDHREGLPAWRRRLPWAIFTVALIGFSLQWLNPSWLQADTYDQTVIAQSLVMGIIFLSFVVVTGMGGMVSLAQATFVTAGGFAGGWALSRDWGIDIPAVAAHGQINFFWALVIGTIAAAALGALFAWPLSKLGGVTLALGTLALAFFFYFVPFGTDEIGKGQLGWTIRAPTLDIPGLNWIHDLLIDGDQPKLDLSQLQDQILVFLVLFGLLTLAIHALQRSASGRAMLAVRSSEVAAEASGVRANRTKIMIFALSAAIAGFGGVLLGLYSFSFSNTTAPPYIGLFWLALAVTFGIRRPAGALLAGFAFAAGPAVFHWIANSALLGGGTAAALVTSIYFVPILSGLGAIQLAQEPDGILALVGQQRLRKKRAKERAAHVAAAEAAAHDGVVPEHEIVHAPADDQAVPLAASPAPATDAVLVHGRHRRRLRRRRSAPWCRPATRSRHRRRVARRQRRGQVDALLGRRRRGRRDVRHGAARGTRHHARVRRTGGLATACSSSPKRAASSPASPWRRISPCSSATPRSASRRSTGSRSSTNGASRSRACCPAASSRC